MILGNRSTPLPLSSSIAGLWHQKNATRIAGSVAQTGLERAKSGQIAAIKDGLISPDQLSKNEYR